MNHRKEKSLDHQSHLNTTNVITKSGGIHHLDENFDLRDRKSNTDSVAKNINAADPLRLKS